jgi:hypothetical protein
MKRIVIVVIAALMGMAFSAELNAQFKEEAFSQSYNDDKNSPKDSTDVLFSFKEFFGGVAHKVPVRIGTLAAGSVVFPGTGQIYNRDYWKLPLVYAGIIGGVTGGLLYRKAGETGKSTLCFAAAGAAYWGMVLDEVICFQPSEFPHAGKATIYSILVPGLGQIYNGEAWKLPIYWGGLLSSAHFYVLNKVNYKRFQRIYREATGEDAASYDGPIGAETALYYRNVYRRYRDYSVLFIAGFYLLQVIDANVFSYMHDFNISDDLALSVSPTLISPDNSYALGPSGNSAFGVRFGLTF